MTRLRLNQIALAVVLRLGHRDSSKDVNLEVIAINKTRNDGNVHQSRSIADDKKQLNSRSVGKTALVDGSESL